MVEREPRKVNGAAVVELLKTEGLDYRDSAHSWTLFCPECGKQKWAIRKTDGYSKCYKCDHDFKGFCDYTLSKALGKSKAELTKLLYGVIVTMEVTQREESRFVDHWEETDRSDVEVVELRTWPEEVLPSPDHRELDTPLGAPGLDYLESRGISLELAKEYGLKYNPAESRVVFPIVVEGVLRGWQARYIKPTEFTTKEGKTVKIPKIVSEGAVGGKVLMFQDRLRGADHVVLVEGPVDAMKCHLIGGNVACMGKDNVTPAVLDIIVQHYGIKKVYLGLDRDADKATMKAIEDLTWYDGVEVYRLEPAPGRGDLGDGSLEENLEQFRIARRLRSGQLVTSF